MKYEKLEIDHYPTAKCGDYVEVDNKVYVVIGYTDAGSKLLIQAQGEFNVFKLVRRTKKEVL